jgi:hypothetical protein
MKWQIIIVSERSRRELLDQLLSLLEPQIDALGLRKFEQVDVLIHEDETGKLYGKPAEIGEMREYVRKKSTGEYINFIDSDDLVTPDYVSSILPLLDGIDQVGFEVKCFNDRTVLGVASHSLKHGGWTQTRNANGRMGDPMKFCRDISHLNPMRRELSLAARMSGGVGEDNRWANDLRTLGIVKTEHFIPRVLYWYLWRGNKNDAADARDPWRLKVIEGMRAQTGR